jgi:hypothetical protein
MMKYLLIALLTFSTLVNAEENQPASSVWQKLDAVPASQYDIGRLYLDILTLQIKDALIGNEVPDTHYSIGYFGAIEIDNRLGFKISYIAEGQYISPSDCNGLLELAQRTAPVKNLIPAVWPKLKSYGILAKDIENNFVYAVELINKDNNSIFANCHN